MGQGQSMEQFPRPSRSKRRQSKNTLVATESSSSSASRFAASAPTHRPDLVPGHNAMVESPSALTLSASQSSGMHQHQQQLQSPYGTSPAPTYSTLASTRSGSGSDRSLLAPPVFVAPPPPMSSTQSPPLWNGNATTSGQVHMPVDQASRRASTLSSALSSSRASNRPMQEHAPAATTAPGLRNASPPRSPSSTSSASRMVDLVRTKSHRLVRKASTALSSAASSSSRRRAATHHNATSDGATSRLRVVALSSSMTEVDSSHDDNISLPTNVHQALHVEYDPEINKFRGVPRAWHDSFRDFGFTDECLDHLDSLDPHLAPLPPLPPVPPAANEATRFLPRTNRSMINLPMALSNASTFFSRRRNASTTTPAVTEADLAHARAQHVRSRTDSTAFMPTVPSARQVPNGGVFADGPAGNGLASSPSIVGHLARPAEHNLSHSVSSMSLQSTASSTSSLRIPAESRLHERNWSGTGNNPLYPIQDENDESDEDDYAQQRYCPSGTTSNRHPPLRHRSRTADAASDSSRLSGVSTSSSVTITASRMTRGAPPVASPSSTSAFLGHSRPASASSTATATPRASVVSSQQHAAPSQQQRRPSTAPSTAGRRGSTDSNVSTGRSEHNRFPAGSSAMSMTSRRGGPAPPPLPTLADGSSVSSSRSRPESPAVPRTPLTPITPRVPTSFNSGRSTPVVKTPTSFHSVTPTSTARSTAKAESLAVSQRQGSAGQSIAADLPLATSHLPPSPSVSSFLASLSSVSNHNDSATDLTRTSSPTIHPLLISMIESNKFKSDHAPTGAAIGSHSPASYSSLLTPISAQAPVSSTLSDMLAEAAAGPAVPATDALTLADVTDSGDPTVLFTHRTPYAEAGRGMVYQAEDAAVAGARVAIKVVDQDDAWIVRELAVLRRARHRGIVPLVGAFLEPTSHSVWVVTELYDGGSLADLLGEMPACVSAMEKGVVPNELDADTLPGSSSQQACLQLASPAAMASVMFPLLHALHFIHTRMCIVHGDLRSDNVLVACDGRVALAPHWRSACAIGGPVRVPGDQPVYWMPPEAAKATATATIMDAQSVMPAAPAMDVYALGMVLAELVTGGAYPDQDEEEEMDAVARVALQGAKGGPREMVVAAVSKSGDRGALDVAVDFFDKCTTMDPVERTSVGDLLGHALVAGWTEDKCKRHVRQMVYIAGSLASSGSGCSVEGGKGKGRRSTMSSE